MKSSKPPSFIQTSYDGKKNMFGMATVKSRDPARLQLIEKMVEKSKKTEAVLQRKMESCKSRFKNLDGELAFEEKLMYDNASLAV